MAHRDARAFHNTNAEEFRHPPATLLYLPGNTIDQDRPMSGGDAMQISRRDMLGAGVTAAAAALTTTATFGGWEASERYPDPAIKVLDPSFLKYRVFNASVQRLFTGARWSEGPVWIGDPPHLLSSDLPHKRIPPCH